MTLILVCVLDIGGGAVSDEAKHSLARIPLRWMIRQCFLAETGIQLDVQKLCAIGLDPSVLYPVVLLRNTILKKQFNRSSAFLVHTPDSEVNSDDSLAKSSPHTVPIQFENEDREEELDAISPLNDPLSLHHREIRSYKDVIRKMFWWNLENAPTISYEKVGRYRLLRGFTYVNIQFDVLGRS